MLLVKMPFNQLTAVVGNVTRLLDWLTGGLFQSVTKWLSDLKKKIACVALSPLTQMQIHWQTTF